MNTFKYKLSYVLNTRNKLPYLRVAVAKLLENVQTDEEIIVIDGNSSDGSKEFLNGLFRAGKIHQFISEPDAGKAHGYNKGLLLTQGELIKPITDDDVVYYPEIQKCKKFMLSNPKIDALSADGVGYDINKPEKPSASEYYKQYKIWKKNHQSFPFCGMGMMIRRSSLSYLGLFHTGVVRVDSEYSLRITSGKANFAWYSGLTWAHIHNNQSNSFTQSHTVISEGDRLDLFYSRADWKKMPLEYEKIMFRKIKNKFANLIKHDKGNAIQNKKMNIEETFVLLEKNLEKINRESVGVFLTK